MGLVSKIAAPFLVALSPVVFLYAHNIEQVLFYDTLLSIGIVLGLAVILLLLFLAVFRSIERASIFTAFFLLAFFSYGHLFSLREIYGLRERYLIGGTILPLVIIFLWLLRTQKDLKNLNRFILLFTSILLAISIVQIGVFQTRALLVAKKQAPVIAGIDVGSRPDIYYFLVDGYASQWELSNFYGNDNSEFIDYLKQKGFYVVPESRSNYAKTEFSLSTILNLDYLEKLSAGGKLSAETTRPPVLLQNHRVWQFLKPLGYKYYHFGSWWEGTYNNRYADVNVNMGYMPEFPTLLYRSVERFLPWQPAFLDVRRLQWERTLYQFEELSKIPKREDRQPVFVFVHFITHSPFVFNEDGSFFEDDAAKKVDTLGKKHYLDQLLFLNKKLSSVIDTILSESKTAPVIVIQSDHGSRDVFDENVTDVNKYSDEYLGRHLRNFSAFNLPGNGNGVLWKDITPVNTFRAIFKKYFGADLQPLPDRSFMTLPGYHYDIIDVTDRVKYE